tara:strand:+ start:1620 stop:5987 length:4368 start_codon:yes stop_codon:yes gene_type:complete
MAQVIVNKTDTFENQRQKINEIGYDLHTFTGTQTGLNATYLTWSDLNVTVNSAGGGGGLTYDNTNGQFVYTPPDLSNFITSIGDAIQDADFPSAGLMKTDGSGGYSVVTDNSANWIALTDLSVTQNTPGNSGLSYNNITGILSFTPEDVSGFLTLTGISINTAVAGTAGLAYNNSTGVFTYTPPDLSSYLTTVALNDLSNVDATTNLGDGKILKYNVSNTTWEVADDTGGTTPTLAQVTASGNTTTTSITAANLISSDAGGFTLGTSTYASFSRSAGVNTLNGNASDFLLIADNLTYTSGSTVIASFSSTGLNITGTVESDGSTTDGDAIFKGANADVTWDKSADALLFPAGTSISDKAGSKGTVGQTLSSDGAGGIEYVSQTIEGISNVDINSIQTNQILKWDGTKWVNAADTGGSGAGIALGDLSVGAEPTAAGNGGLAYNNLTGQFTFTPAADNTLVFNHANATTSQIVYTNNGAGTPQTLNLVAGTGITFGQGGGTGNLVITGTSGIVLSDLSVGSNASASGGGGIAYNDSTGVFTYTPPDLSSYLTSVTETDTLETVTGRGATSTNNVIFTGGSGAGRLDVQNAGAYAITLDAATGISTDDGKGLYIGNLSTNVWRAKIEGSTGDLTANSIIKTGGTSSQFLKADGSVDSSTYLTTIDLSSKNLNDLADVNAGSPTDGHVLKWDNGTSKWISASDQTATGGSGIALADLSITTATAGTAALAYNDTTGVFTYTPPDLSAASTDLTAFSVGSNASASGSGGLAYTNTSGVFTYTPPDLSSYLTAVAVNDLSDVTIASPQNGHVLKYNGASWENAPDAGGSTLTTEEVQDIVGAMVTGNTETGIGVTYEDSTGTLDFTVNGINLNDLGDVKGALNPSTNDVLQYDGSEWIAGDPASFGIALTDISVTSNTAGTAALSYDNVTGVFSYTPPNVSTFIALTSLSVGSPQVASGSGAISYNNANGVFSYTPPDLSAYLDNTAVIANLADVVITGSPTSGQVLKWDNATSKWTNQADANSNVTDPGGSDTQVQFNDSGSFEGDASLVWDNTNNKLKVGNADSDSYLLVGSNTKRAELRNNNTSTYLYSYADSTFHIAAAGSGTTIQLDWVSGVMAYFKKNAEVGLNYANVLCFETADGGCKFHGGIIDKDNDIGSSGQILSSTGTEIEWINPPTPSLAINDLTDVTTGSVSTNDVLTYNGTAWAAAAPTGGGDSFPAGGIIMWSGAQSAIPNGWVLCDGNNSTPDLRNRFVVGAGNSYAVDATGGASTVTLTEAQMPSHSHSVDNHTHSIGSHSHTVDNHSHSIGSHTHSFSGSGSGTSGTQSDNHYHSGNTSNSGSHAHSIYGSHQGTINTGGTRYLGDSNGGTNMGTVNSGTTNAHAHYFDTLGVSEDHTHNTTISISGTTGGGSGSTGSENPGTSSNGNGNTGNANPNTNSKGSGSSHENLPPYYALCYIMKT